MRRTTGSLQGEAALCAAAIQRGGPSATGREGEFHLVPMRCRSPVRQFPPKAALWQHVVRVLPAKSGSSQIVSKAVIGGY